MVAAKNSKFINKLQDVPDAKPVMSGSWLMDYIVHAAMQWFPGEKNSHLTRGQNIREYNQTFKIS